MPPSKTAMEAAQKYAPLLKASKNVIDAIHSARLDGRLRGREISAVGELESAIADAEPLKTKIEICITL